MQNKKVATRKPVYHEYVGGRSLSTLRVINASQMRKINRSAVLELIRQKSPIARSEIGRKLGLSLPTVMRIVDKLLEENLVYYTGDTEWSSGRRRRLLAYNKQESLVIGVDLGGTKIFGTLANIGGEILEEKYSEWFGIDAQKKYITLIDIIKYFMNTSYVKESYVRGIAIGVPGLTYSKKGIVRWAPALNWRDVPIKEQLEDEFNIPVFVENDVNLAVLGENRFGVGKGVDDLVLIAVGTGMGAGLIINGQLVHGEDDAAGEVGFLIPGRDALGEKYDDFGPMERIISGPGIADFARKKLMEVMPADELTKLTSKDVFFAAKNGESWAEPILEVVIDYLTITIADISTILNPKLIILGGGVSESAQMLIPAIRDRLDGLVMYPPKIEVSNLGYRASVFGAIALTVLETTGYIGNI